MSLQDDLKRVMSPDFGAQPQRNALAPAKPQHDLAGLEAFMALTLPLEQALTTLAQYEQAYRDQLRPAEQDGLRRTIQSLAMTLQTVMDRPGRHAQGTA